MQVEEFAKFFDIDSAEAAEIMGRHTMLEETSIDEVKAVLSVFCEYGMSIFDAKTFGYIFPQLLLLSPNQMREKLDKLREESEERGVQLLQMIIHTPNILLDYETVKTRVTII